MKKKILLLVLALCLVASLVGVMVACGNVTDALNKLAEQMGEEEDENGEETGEETGDETGDEGEESGNNGQGVSIAATATVKAKVNELKGTTGFYATYVYTSAGQEVWTISVGAKGDLYYIKDAASGEMYFDLSANGSYDQYSFDGEAWVKTTIEYNDALTKEFEEEVLTSALDAIVSVYGNDVELTGYVKTDATYLNRPVAKYELTERSASFGGATSYTHVVFVDKELNIVVKASAAASVNSIGGSAAASYEIKCTELQTRYTVELPADYVDANE